MSEAYSEVLLFDEIETLPNPKKKRIKPLPKMKKTKKQVSRGMMQTSLFAEEEEETESQGKNPQPQSQELAILAEAAEKNPLLTFEEEQELFKKYQYGETQEIQDNARKKIICSNIRLVISIAKRVRKLNNKLSLDDMVSEGVLGLMRAVEKFDAERHYKFSTYAYRWIEQNISRAIANTGDTIRLPVHFASNLTKIGRAEAKYRQENADEDVPDEYIENELNLSHEKYMRYKHAVKVTHSLDAEVQSPHDKARTVSYKDLIIDEETPTPETAFADKLWKNDIKNVMKNILSVREREVVAYHFGLWDYEVLTIDQIAKKFSLTKERIRQIESTAFGKLRAPVKTLQKQHLG